VVHCLETLVSIHLLQGVQIEKVLVEGINNSMKEWQCLCSGRQLRVRTGAASGFALFLGRLAMILFGRCLTAGSAHREVVFGQHRI
jgi:hypothetical protein